MSNPFDYINSISHTKKDMMRGTENDELAERGYKPFLANRSLSYHSDCILYVNAMNGLGNIDSLLQYDFYMNALRSKKRYSKWSKPGENENIEVISEYFNYNPIKATQASTILSDTDLSNIKKELCRGGTSA